MGVPRQGSARAQTALDVLTAVDEALATRRFVAPPSLPTGFSPLDGHLAGGLRPGDLMVIGALQGVGKTTFALQIARNVVASAAGAALYASFEHDDLALLERILVMEAWLAVGHAAPPLQHLRRRIESRSSGAGSLADVVGDMPGIEPALEALRRYGERLQFSRARGGVTGVDDLAALAKHAPVPPVVFVDYLQKLHAGDGVSEEVQVRKVACALKDLALELSVPVVAVTALDRLGHDERRARARHLKGSVTLAYEADAVLIINEKQQIVARDHLMYGVGNLERFRDFVVCSLEKNRSGRAAIDLEFEKRFEHGCFEATGSVVSENLIGDRIHVE